MLKSEYGRIQIGIPKDAEPQEQKAEIFADLCCLLDGISQLLGRNATAKLLCDAIEAVYTDELTEADNTTKGKEKENKQ